MWVFIFHWLTVKQAPLCNITWINNTNISSRLQKTDRETNYYSQPLENVPYCTAAMHTQWGISQYPTDCMWFMEGTKWTFSTLSSSSQVQLSLRPWSSLLYFDLLIQMCENLQPTALERSVLCAAHVLEGRAEGKMSLWSVFPHMAQDRKGSKDCPLVAVTLKDRCLLIVKAWQCRFKECVQWC